MVGEAIEARVEIGDFGGLQDAQVAFGQRGVVVAGQGAVPGDGGRQAIAQQRGVTFAADVVGEHAGKRQVRLPGGEAVGDGGESLRHGLGVDHGHDRNAEAPRDVGAGRIAVEQPHHPFDEDQVGVPGGGVESPRGVFGPADAEIEVINRRAAGDGVDLRIEKIRPALEHANLAPLAHVQAREGGGDGGLALAGRRRGNEQSRAMGAAHRPSSG